MSPGAFPELDNVVMMAVLPGERVLSSPAAAHWLVLSPPEASFVPFGPAVPAQSCL